ncbi:AAA family ATPase [Tropicimonas sp. TH_r6]|uniref:AAA family ATPase n=1 Tax=Tropicimonas sp. TH_r6 TaxID=3082085 RepID=UPI002954515D|nr:AAA family ATPase [Tropicimonas sp. TH_r6]MDV7143523.1 AAA family ATPase [Tropicimonas sp. TH_r6]
MTETKLIQIKKRRSNGQFSARSLSEDGRVIDAAKSLVVSVPKSLRELARPGTIWRVVGTEGERHFKAGSFVIHETHFVAKTAEFIKPSPRLFEVWLRHNIDRIGEVRAGRLARHPKLIQIIEARDDNALRDLGLPDFAIEQIYEKFPKDEHLAAIHWLSERDLDVGISHTIVKTWQGRTVEFLEADPFVLRQFGVSFRKCAAIATAIGISEEDPVYRAAQVADIIGTFCSRTGSTAMPKAEFVLEVEKREVDPDQALRAAGARKVVVETSVGYQLEGPFLLEHFVASKILEALNRPDGSGSAFAEWEHTVSDEKISRGLELFESSIPFSLTPEQRKAVIGATTNKVCALSGGAGVGKTTILTGVLALLDHLSRDTKIVLLAFSGRAASRMAEATGREAHTIFKFVQELKRTPLARRPDHVVAVIDEASMVDLKSMYDLLRLLPPATRWIVVGDDQQLPPISPGLVFHAIMKSVRIPHYRLTAVKRQSEQSGIHKFGSAIRRGKSVSIPTFDQEPNGDCILYPISNARDIADLYFDMGGQEQCMVLSPTDRGVGGVREINWAIQSLIGVDRPRLGSTENGDDWQGWITEKGSRIYEGDCVIVTKNDYAFGIRNGFLGRVTKATTSPCDEIFGVAEINGEEVSLGRPVLEKLELGFAATIHKAQGSQWPNVILVLPETGACRQMLDRTLVYTGSTRAQQNLVVCCKDLSTVQRAVDRGSRSLQRTVNLPSHLM